MVLRASLGEEIPDHYIEDPSEAEIRTGYQLIHEGRADRNGSKSQYISRFYTCVSCHNTVREDPDLTKVDQEARLQYAVETGIAYLQGSTFWGIVNRTVWYNDDYVKKYGELVVEANKSLQASIQLCAQECSQGRELEEWEMQAILAYLSTLEVKVADLGLSEAESELLNRSSLANEDKLKLLDSKFLDRSPATFSELPSDKQAGYPFEGRTDIGRHIYEISCQYCHKEDGVSDLVLDNSRKTFKWLKKNIKKDMRYSLYEIIRKGTYAEYGHREYMPHYTLEKMSHQQVEDLRAYIEQQAD
ncbi:MAG: cytochrome c [Flavobacteriales bacterium]|nr:cytochrome c [Flavobacteriales bacterium]